MNEKKQISDLEKIQDEIDYQTANENASELINQFDLLTSEGSLQKLNSEYLSFEQGTKYSFIFNGFTEIKTNDGNDVKCAVLIDKDNLKHINGSAVLVKALSSVTQMPCFVRIVTKGFVKAKNGSYLDMDIFVLPQTVAK